MMFKAVEYKIVVSKSGDRDVIPTGIVEYYLAETRKEAVDMCLYTHRLSYKPSYIGASGITVYAGNLYYYIRENDESTGRPRAAIDANLEDIV